MLVVRPVPRRGEVLWSAISAFEVTAVLVTAHTSAGGTLPSMPWMLAMAAATFGVGLLVATQRLRLRVAVPGLVATQLLCHVYLALLAPVHGTMPAAGAHVHAAATDPASLLSWPMLAAHLIGALATAVLWDLRARWIEVLLARANHGLLPAPSPRRRTTTTPTFRLGRGIQVVLLAPRRGPPVIASLA